MCITHVRVQVPPRAPSRSKLWIACSDLFYMSERAHAAAPPFRKKSRSAHLLGCKRPRNGSLSLPTFCEYESSTPTAEMPKKSFSCGLDTSEWTMLHSKSPAIRLGILNAAPPVLLSAKGHACCGYALVKEGMTPPLRSQFFAGCARGQIHLPTPPKYLFHEPLTRCSK